MSRAEPPESPLRGDAFLVEVDGLSTASFSACAGLGSEVDVLAYREGGSSILRWFRGVVRPMNLVLEKGVTRGSYLFDWFISGEPRDGAIVLIDNEGDERSRWSFHGGWPRAWFGPELDASAPSVALERVEIVHEGIECVRR